MIRNRHTIKNDQDQDIVGILETPFAQQQDHVLVLCHGRSVDKDELGVFISIADAVIAEGVDVFRFDYRGSGQSDGTDLDMTISSEKEDTITVCNYLASIGYKQATLLAASFAGGPVVLAWEEIITIEKKGLILRNAMTEYTEWRKKMQSDEYKNSLEKKGYIERSPRRFRASKECFDEMTLFEPHKKLAEITQPMIIIHGTEDVHIPYEDAVRHSKQYGIELLTIQGGKHGFHNLEKRRVAIKGVVRFIKNSSLEVGA